MEHNAKTLSRALTAVMSASVGVGNYYGSNVPTQSSWSEVCKNKSAPKWKKKRRKAAQKSRKINRRKQ